METKHFRGNPYDETCPTRQVLNLVGDKWTVLIIGLLQYHHTLRFSEMKHIIQGISQKMLTQTLRSLERNGIVERTIYPQVPPRVEYKLTPLGVTLSEPIRAIKEWAETHISDIVAAQVVYDAEQDEAVG
jgi:DNA-binding HxlR family transcriptional regulator